MDSFTKTSYASGFLALCLSININAEDVTTSVNGEICEGFGPQTPRNIDEPRGENKRIFSLAPKYQDLNLCNIHFHVNAEHKAKDFSIFAGENGQGGYQCLSSQSLSKAGLSRNARKQAIWAFSST